MAIPDPDILNEMVRRIVDVAHPLRIILFGSAARGEMGPDSDLDFLVVMPDGVHRRKVAITAYNALGGLGIPKDILVVTENDIQQYGGNHSLVIAPALAEG
ncbi:MAG: nucleotidyltransferase domain-containing protein [Magnetococcus sp. MYC-9]